MQRLPLSITDDFPQHLIECLVVPLHHPLCSRPVWTCSELDDVKGLLKDSLVNSSPSNSDPWTLTISSNIPSHVKQFLRNTLATVSSSGRPKLVQK